MDGKGGYSIPHVCGRVVGEARDAMLIKMSVKACVVFCWSVYSGWDVTVALGSRNQPRLEHLWHVSCLI